MLRSPKTNQRLERHLAFEVNGESTASIVIGSDLATLADNGTGLYTLTFNKPFARAPIVLCQSFTDVQTVRVVTRTVSAIQVEVTGADQTTPADGDFFCLVIGWDTVEEYGDEN